MLATRRGPARVGGWRRGGEGAGSGAGDGVRQRSSPAAGQRPRRALTAAEHTEEREARRAREGERQSCCGRGGAARWRCDAHGWRVPLGHGPRQPVAGAAGRRSGRHRRGRRRLGGEARKKAGGEKRRRCALAHGGHTRERTLGECTRACLDGGEGRETRVGAPQPQGRGGRARRGGTATRKHGGRGRDRRLGKQPANACARGEGGRVHTSTGTPTTAAALPRTAPHEQWGVCAHAPAPAAAHTRHPTPRAHARRYGNHESRAHTVGKHHTDRHAGARGGAAARRGWRSRPHRSGWHPRTHATPLPPPPTRETRIKERRGRKRKRVGETHTRHTERAKHRGHCSPALTLARGGTRRRDRAAAAVVAVASARHAHAPAALRAPRRAVEYSRSPTHKERVTKSLHTTRRGNGGGEQNVSGLQDRWKNGKKRGRRAAKRTGTTVRHVVAVGEGQRRREKKKRGE